MTAAGGTVTASRAFEPNQASYRSDLQVLANSGADALVLVAHPDDGGLTILRQALEEGLFDRFILTDGMKAEGLLTEIEASIWKAPTVPAARAVESDASEVWREAFEAAYGEMPPVPYIDGAYDAAWILMLAIEKAGSTDGTAIRDAIREVSSAPGEKVMPGEWEKAKELIAAGTDIDYVGAAGEHEFDENGDVSGTFEHWAILDGQIQSVAVFDPSE